MNLGVDIEEVSRFKTLIRNKRFLSRVFTPREIKYCLSKKNQAQHFAVRFSAKEAVWKSLSDIISKSKKPIRHRQIEIENTPSGKPKVILPPSLARWKNKISVSLSHTHSYAVAISIVQG